MDKCIGIYSVYAKKGNEKGEKYSKAYKTRNTNLY